jgi:hypothetical protein
MIQISFDKVIPSRNELEYCTKMKKVRHKEWWQEKTEERLKGWSVEFYYLIVLIKIYFKNYRSRDIDNYMASLGVKGIIDGIVSCGLIPDDDAAHLNYSIDLLIDKENPRTEVILYGSKEDEEYYR